MVEVSVHVVQLLVRPVALCAVSLMLPFRLKIRMFARHATAFLGC
jgi:hypothetical protein